MSAKAQRVINIAPEATGGAGATPDVALRATSTLHAVVDKIQPDEDIGSFAPGRHYIGSKKAEGELRFDPVYYEHLPYPISMAMGDGSPTGTGPTVWTFPLPDDTAETFATYQMETSDGADHVVLSKDVFATALQISGEAGKGIVVTATLTGGDTSYPAALTSALDEPVTVTELVMGNTTLAVDALYANIGNTAVNEFISFTWKLEDLQHPKLFGGAMYPSGRGNGKWKVTLDVIIEAETTAAETLKDQLLTEGTQAIRIRTYDANAGGAGIHWYMNIDGTYYTREIKELDERDGNNTMKISLVGQIDTLGNTGAIVVGCGLAAL